jgi:hypothetical protein
MAMWQPRSRERARRYALRSIVGAGMDEALGLASGARRIGFGSQMVQAGPDLQ